MKKLFSTVILLVLLCLSTTTTSVFANQRYNYWSYEYGSWRYINSSGGYTVDKWIYDNGNWYYVDYLGRMATGWLCIWEYNGLTLSGGTDGTWYYFNNDGTLVAS